MESLDCSRAIQIPLVDRIVFQRTETDITTARFYRIQRERGQMADMDRTAGPFDPEISQTSLRLETQFFPSGGITP